MNEESISLSLTFLSLADGVKKNGNTDVHGTKERMGMLHLYVVGISSVFP